MYLSRYLLDSSHSNFKSEPSLPRKQSIPEWEVCFKNLNSDCNVGCYTVVIGEYVDVSPKMIMPFTITLKEGMIPFWLLLQFETNRTVNINAKRI